MSISKTEVRNVHAERDDGTQIVRYERAGKWYAEFLGGVMKIPRKALTIAAASQQAVEWERIGGIIHLGRPGGGAFDAKVARLTERRA